MIAYVSFLKFYQATDLNPPRKLLHEVSNPWTRVYTSLHLESHYKVFERSKINQQLIKRRPRRLLSDKAPLCLLKASCKTHPQERRQSRCRLHIKLDLDNLVAPPHRSIITLRSLRTNLKEDRRQQHLVTYSRLYRCLEERCHFEASESQLLILCENWRLKPRVGKVKIFIFHYKF